MCGIVGFITKDQGKGEAARRKFMQQALFVDTLRGSDSAGAFAVGHKPLFVDGSADFLKRVGPAPEFLASKDYRKKFGDVSPYRSVIGHNRAATVGGLDVDSAHPFSEGPITLVHNGTLHVTHTLPIPMHSLTEVTVDSHAIAHNLANHTLAEVVKTLDGAFVLVWHDARDDSVNVVRNSRRPIHLSLDSTGSTVYMASEGEMLDFLGKRMSLGLKEILYPEPGQHLKWLADTPLESPVIEDLPLYTHSYNTGWSGRSQWWDDPNWSRGGRNAPTPITTTRTDSVIVDGSRKAVPDLLQERLMDLGYDVDDQLDFQPGQAVPNSTGGMAVEGKVEGTYDAIIYDIPVATYERYGNSPWTVKPLAISANDASGDLLIVRLHTVSTPARTEVAPSVRGPSGRLISRKYFYNLTEKGCHTCGAVITVIEADYVEWEGKNGYFPVCPQCAHARKEGNK